MTKHKLWQNTNFGERKQLWQNTNWDKNVIAKELKLQQHANYDTTSLMRNSNCEKKTQIVKKFNRGKQINLWQIVSKLKVWQNSNRDSGWIKKFPNVIIINLKKVDKPKGGVVGLSGYGFLLN